MSEQFKEPESIWKDPRFQNAFASGCVLAMLCMVMLLAMIADKLFR